MSLEKSNVEPVKDIPLGEGREKRVFLESKGYARADFLTELSEEQAQSVFYVATIAHTLFPNNFPKPAASWKDEQGSHYRSEYIEPDESLKLFHEISGKRDGDVQSASEYKELTEDYFMQMQAISERRRFPQVLKFVEDAHTAGLLFIENAPGNFSLKKAAEKEDVGFTYTDIEPAWRYGKHTIDLERIQSAAQNLPEDKKNIISQCVQKIQELHAQEKTV